MYPGKNMKPALLVIAFAASGNNPWMRSMRHIHYQDTQTICLQNPAQNSMILFPRHALAQSFGTLSKYLSQTTAEESLELDVRFPGYIYEHNSGKEIGHG